MSGIIRKLIERRISNKKDFFSFAFSEELRRFTVLWMLAWLPLFFHIFCNFGSNFDQFLIKVWQNCQQTKLSLVSHLKLEGNCLNQLLWLNIQLNFWKIGTFLFYFSQKNGITYAYLIFLFSLAGSADKKTAGPILFNSDMNSLRLWFEGKISEIAFLLSVANLTIFLK